MKPSFQRECTLKLCYLFYEDEDSLKCSLVTLLVQSTYILGFIAIIFAYQLLRGEPVFLI